MTARPPNEERRVVVHVIDSLGRSGGAEQQLVENLRRFCDPRLTHRILCLYDAGADSRASDLPPRVEVAYLGAEGSRTRNRLLLIVRVWMSVRGMRPDLLHCALPDAALATRVSGRMLGIPVIETLVNISHEPVRLVDNDAVSRTKLRFHRRIDRVTMRWVARFQALSRTVADSWIENVGLAPDLVKVIPRGIARKDLDPARDSVVAELGLPPDSYLILNVGRQVAQKGQIYLVRAMPAVLDRIPNAILVSVGSPGPMTGDLMAEVDRLNLGAQVRWLGTRADVDRLMSATDVFVFPSLFEGLGVSLLEALAARLPCVTTERGPMTEVVTHEVTGLTVAAQDPQALADAVVRLAEDGALAQQLSRAGRHAVLERFDIERVSRQVEDMYLELLGLL
jgi:glycosyltransferase involved in cell wall biosynthesis